MFAPSQEIGLDLCKKKAPNLKMSIFIGLSEAQGMSDSVRI